MEDKSVCRRVCVSITELQEGRVVIGHFWHCKSNEVPGRKMLLFLK